MFKKAPSKRQIFMGIFAIIVAFLALEIYRFDKMYKMAGDAPTFQTLGSPSSPVQIVEFTDYNCGHCRNAYPVILDAIKDLNDIYYVARPVPSLGPESERLTRITLAAGLQDKFWFMHEEFMRHKGDITDEFINEVGRKHNVNLQRLYLDTESAEITKLLLENNKAAYGLGVRYTPTLVVNKTIFVPTGDNMNVPRIRSIINDARHD